MEGNEGKGRIVFYRLRETIRDSKESEANARGRRLLIALNDSTFEGDKRKGFIDRSWSNEIVGISAAASSGMKFSTNFSDS